MPFSQYDQHPYYSLDKVKLPPSEEAVCFFYLEGTQVQVTKAEELRDLIS